MIIRYKTEVGGERSGKNIKRSPSLISADRPSLPVPQDLQWLTTDDINTGSSAMNSQQFPSPRPSSV